MTSMPTCMEHVLSRPHVVGVVETRVLVDVPVKMSVVTVDLDACRVGAGVVDQVGTVSPERNREEYLRKREEGKGSQRATLRINVYDLD